MQIKLRIVQFLVFSSLCQIFYIVLKFVFNELPFSTTWKVIQLMLIGLCGIIAWVLTIVLTDPNALKEH
ncbi:hypothetical protein NV379_03200 [Paenibacillus sp. N1-5-1-14]|uniref:hypothetical protein n=1 Tax=Paenibacillus radicibacter TaxID=2972488 RepID=UPI0021592BC0|nr:hypothetical protein [Paenibacillus radicibacter]MCR8641654.1 hypothetical protein [Paenibacillus radicibacter]